MPIENSTQSSDTGAAAGLNDSFVVGKTAERMEIHGTLVRLTRYLAVFEIYGAGVAVRVSEVFAEFKIVLRDRTTYRGRAVVRSLVDSGSNTICEVTLNESSWVDIEFTSKMIGTGKLRDEFQNFMGGWQKFYKVLPEYKVIIADMQTFLSDLRIWLDQVELGIHSLAPRDQPRIEKEVADELALAILPCVDVLFDKFEMIAEDLEEELRPAHQSYMRRHLHSLVLSAPFAGHAFNKPLGYAGDYEIVNMILRNAHEGSSLFAKIINTWFLRQVPSQAHRNRITFLVQTLEQETLRVSRSGRSARIFNMACGPAQEIQLFLAESPLAAQANFTLLDFNEETLQYVRSVLDEIKTRCSRNTPIEYIKKSVHHLIKASSKMGGSDPEKQYDFVYCAGLFDYLSDQVCLRLMNLMYGWLAPGGLLVATNVEPSNPNRHGMGHLLDWHLIYRNARQFREIIPTAADAENCRVHSDSTGVNLFLEVRKPDDE